MQRNECKKKTTLTKIFTQKAKSKHVFFSCTILKKNQCKDWMYSLSAKNLTLVGQIHAKPKAIDWVEGESLTRLKRIRVELWNWTKSVQNQVSPKVFMVAKGVYKWWMPLESLKVKKLRGLNTHEGLKKRKGFKGTKARKPWGRKNHDGFRGNRNLRGMKEERLLRFHGDKGLGIDAWELEG